ncbi:MAG: hypothetical protein PUB00_02420, partial [Clostridiales bacterium]|nr:hypothetical protein [Clostridiales bacterium]
MKRDILNEAQEYMKVHQKKKRWHQVVIALACVVVFCTTYVLILPAITMENSGSAQTEQEQVTNVITLIDALPDSNTVEDKLTAYEDAENDEAYEAYYQEVSLQAKTAYSYYQELSPQLQQQVTNAAKLTELEWLWTAAVYSVTNTIDVYQVNYYSQAVTTLVYGGTVGNKTSGMRFEYWIALIVEKDSSTGKLYVNTIMEAKAGVSKVDCKATTADGFVLLTLDAIDVKVNDEVRVDFDYKNTTGYSATKYGTVTVGADLSPKPAKDNTGKLTIVPGADTRDLIEVNLYDYGSNI